MLTLSNPTTSLTASWMKTISWNSKNINKVDPFRLSPCWTKSRAKHEKRFVPFPSNFFFPSFSPTLWSSQWKVFHSLKIYPPTTPHCEVKPTSSSYVQTYPKARYTPYKHRKALQKRGDSCWASTTKSFIRNCSRNKKILSFDIDEC